jgi:drug/metabolite transporter (DMT)-like permease
MTRLDAWLLLMTFFWGSNFTVIKTALGELPGPAFNGLRMALAAVVFLMLIAWREDVGRIVRSIPSRDWLAIVALSLLGHTLYQYLFLGGVARTSASNSALIFGCTPITVGLLSAWLGHERYGWARWTGTALSFVGIYLVVGHGARQATSSPIGDAMIFGAMLCWAGFTVGCKPLLDRYSPLFITGVTMAIGTAIYAPLALLWLEGVALGSISLAAWAGIVYSALFSLVAAYVIWYTAVQRLGGGHTSMYSNLVPMVAMGIAALVLGEPLTATKLIGAAAVLSGVALTRLGQRDGPQPPAEG